MIVRVALALVLLATAFASGATSAEDEDIAGYFLPAQRLEKQFRASVPALVRQHPELKDDLQYVARHFNGTVISNRSAVLLSKVLTDADRKLILTFMPTPAGKAFGQIQIEYVEPQRQMESINRLSADLRRPLDQFIGSVPAQKVLRTLYSDEATQINQAYGKELRCEYLAKIVPAEHAELVKLGHCPRRGSDR